MSEKALRQSVERVLLTQLAKQGEQFVPVFSSNRHIHLSQQNADALFGAGYRFQRLKNLVQPGQFACKEQVVLQTAKGSLSLRVLGPCRGQTQIELSLTEAITLGIPPVIRMSGNLAGTPVGTVQNGERSITIEGGIIVAARHIHMSAQQAAAYGLKDGDTVSLIAESARRTVFEDVLVRVGDAHLLEAHIDRDEANAAALSDGALCRIRKNGESSVPAEPPAEATTVSTVPKMPRKRDALVTEESIKAALEAGESSIVLPPKAIVTPLARDAARQYNIALIVGKEDAGIDTRTCGRNCGQHNQIGKAVGL